MLLGILGSPTAGTHLGLTIFVPFKLGGCPLPTLYCPLITALRTGAKKKPTRPTGSTRHYALSSYRLRVAPEEGP